MKFQLLFPLTFCFLIFACADESSQNSTEKTVATTQTYKAGEKAFLGVANVWHFSENLGDKDLIFMVTWLGEENGPVAVME